MNDAEHALYEKIVEAIKVLVNKMLADAKLDPAAEEDIRYLLTENVRFWK